MQKMEELPDSLILHILDYLEHQDVCSFAQTCSRFQRIAADDILWRNLFHHHFGVDPGYQDPSGSATWMGEFKRLIDETPFVETEVLAQHTDQVLHVSFSHDGKLFATSGKDGFVYVWRSGHPVTVEYSKNMKFFSWKYTQFTQFNESDTLLLVSGVLFGHHSTSGEIAILNVKDGFQLQCRVMSKPYDIFGSWYSDMFFLSGQHQWLDNLISKSVIWLNIASQESQSEHASVMNELYRFYNPTASSVRTLMIANCVDNEGNSSSSSKEGSGRQETKDKSEQPSCTKSMQTGNPVSNLQHEQAEMASSSAAGAGLMEVNSRGLQATLQGAFQNWRPLDNNPVAHINYSKEYRNQGHHLATSAAATKNSNKAVDEESRTSSMEDLLTDDAAEDRNPSETSTSSPDEDKSQREASVEEDHILDNREKWLIFTCSSLTYTPHRIGFKRIKPMYFNGRIDPGPSIRERIEEYKRRRQLEIDGVDEEQINWADFPSVADKFDTIDHIIDLHGHIIGMTLSPDHRYLYVNSRPWPEGYRVTNPLEPPPIASEIDIHVIDLKNLNQVGMMRRAHRAYTSNEECFFIFLDACDQYVASGAEDKHGYVWDRLYGISLVKLPHLDVVNSVCFNPTNPQMLVSVSDDYRIKVWRSQAECRALSLDTTTLNRGTRLLTRRPRRTSRTAASNSAAV